MEPPSSYLAMIQFPFWLLLPAGPTTGESRLPLAFSSVERMSEYLKVQSHGEWAVQLGVVQGGNQQGAKKMPV